MYIKYSFWNYLGSFSMHRIVSSNQMVGISFFLELLHEMWRALPFCRKGWMQQKDGVKSCCVNRAEIHYHLARWLDEEFVYAAGNSTFTFWRCAINGKTSILRKGSTGIGAVLVYLFVYSYFYCVFFCIHKSRTINSGKYLPLSRCWNMSFSVFSCPN